MLSLARDQSMSVSMWTDKINTVGMDQYNEETVYVGLGEYPHTAQVWITVEAAQELHDRLGAVLTDLVVQAEEMVSPATDVGESATYEDAGLTREEEQTMAALALAQFHQSGI